MRHLFTSFDCKTVDEAIYFIELALFDRPQRLCDHRRKLQDVRDDLHDLCTSLSADGADYLWEDFHFAVSDALGILTLAVYGRAVNGRHLATALSALRLAKEKAVSL